MRKTTFEELIEENGEIAYTNVGKSMLPLIRQHRDLIVISKVNGRLKKYDVPLYKRDNGQYVLHRILKVRGQDYVICGDNCYRKEYGITDRHIIGVLKSVVRDGKEITINNKMYKLYVHLWCDFFSVRYIILRAKNLIKRSLNFMEYKNVKNKH